MIQRKLFLLFLVFAGSVHLDVYSGKNKGPSGKKRFTPAGYHTRTVKYVRPADRNKKLRDARLGHRKENISCKRIGASAALGVMMSLALTCIRPYDPERPIESITTPCIGMLIGFFLGVCLWHEKPTKIYH
jgi:hypothetical protein